jgi:diadenosine tetraphosphate (Ap4A) HIT family hydrolase
MLTDEQAKQIKEQFLNQVEQQIPEDQRSAAKQQISSMTNSELEEFIKKNEEIAQGKMSTESLPEDQCPFCKIYKNEIPSYQIDKNSENIAVLEINPLSTGHTIIIPKEHSNKSNKSSQELAEKVKIKLTERLNPKEVKIETSPMFGHAIINVTPIYEGKELVKKQASENELKKLKTDLTKEIIPEKKKEVKKELEETEELHYPRRIP